MASFNGLPKNGGLRPGRTAPDRARLIRSVHAACKAQGLDEDARRDVQVGATGKASLSDMDAAEISRVLSRLNRGSKAPSSHPHIGKIRALWWTLYWLGAVDGDAEKALDGFVRRQTGIDSLRFLPPRGAHRVTEALKTWAAREGVAWPIDGDALADRAAVLDAIGRKLGDRGDDRRGWTAERYDENIRLAGKRLRAWKRTQSQ